jgi:hypothetical protein
MTGSAAPSALQRWLDHGQTAGLAPCAPDRSGLDVALADEQPAVDLDHGRAEAPFEQGPDSAVGAVKVVDVALPAAFPRMQQFESWPRTRGTLSKLQSLSSAMTRGSAAGLG